MKSSPSNQPTLSRRTLLRAGILAAFSAALAACGRAIVSLPTMPGSSPARTPAIELGATPNTTASASPGATDPLLAGLTLREKIARLLVVGFKGLAVDEAPWLRRAIADDGLGGVILFDRHRNSSKPRNVASRAQVRALISELKALAPDRALIVAIDQEGGLVTRLSSKYGFPNLASEAAVGESGDAAVEAWAEGLVGTLADVGVNLNLAPVVDLDVNPENPAIGALDRAFSADPTVVSSDAALEIRAHRERGVRTALKHFPGLGSASTNTDFGVADVTATWTDKELEPYRYLLANDLVDAVMAAHVVNGQIDPALPASLSARTVDGLLRRDLGWDGVVVTDDLQAAAITQGFGFEESIELALTAGNDLLLFANQQAYDDGIVGRVIDLVERLVEQGRVREARIDAAVARVARLFPPELRVSG